MAFSNQNEHEDEAFPIPSTEDIIGVIRRSLKEIIGTDEFDPITVDPDFNFYANGIIDSYDLVSLIGMVESETGLLAVMRPASGLDDFAISINRLASFFVKRD